MAEPPGSAVVHLSSAVVRTRPERMEEVAARIAGMPGMEVFHRRDGRVVVVLEGPDSNTLGARLAQIALMDGVMSANMVYEQIESEEALGESV